MFTYQEWDHMSKKQIFFVFQIFDILKNENDITSLVSNMDPKWKIDGTRYIPSRVPNIVRTSPLSRKKYMHWQSTPFRTTVTLSPLLLIPVWRYNRNQQWTTKKKKSDRSQPNSEIAFTHFCVVHYQQMQNSALSFSDFKSSMVKYGGGEKVVKRFHVTVHISEEVFQTGWASMKFLKSAPVLLKAHLSPETRLKTCWALCLA